MMTVLPTLIVALVLLADGVSGTAQSYRCFYDTCRPPWQYCNVDEKRCNLCSLDVCGWSTNVPKNCTQACTELLSPSTTTGSSQQEATSNRKVEEKLEGLERMVTTLICLVIGIILLVIAGFGIVILVFRRGQRKPHLQEGVLEEEKRPLNPVVQATQPESFSESSDSSGSAPPAYNRYPGETGLDRGEPPIVATIADSMLPMAPGIPSQNIGGQASTSVTSHNLYPNQSFFPPPTQGAGAKSMPIFSARAGFESSGQGSSNVSSPVRSTTMDYNKNQHQKMFDCNLQIMDNTDPQSIPNGRAEDLESTAPKSNDFGTRPMK